MSFGNFKFGGTPAASTPTPTAPPQQAAGGGTSSFSFGAQNNQQAASTGTGLFGSGNTAQPANQTTGGGLFGSTNQPGTATGGGLFGSTTANQPQQQSGSLFGGGSLFGAKPVQTTTTQPGGMTGGSLFGTQPQQQQQPQQQLQPQPQPQQPSFFGQTQPANQSTSLFGAQNANQNLNNQSQPQFQQNQGGLFNQPPQQNTLQQSTSSSSSSSAINKSTKFADLPEQVQKTIEQMDSWIKQQKSTGSDINIDDLGRAIWQTSADVKSANEEYSALSQGLTSLQTSLNQLRAKFLTEEDDLRKIAEIWETFKSVDGRPGAVRVAAHRDFPQDFFSRAADGMEERVQRYKKTIAQLNRVVISLSRENDGPTPQAIAQTIQNHQNAIVTLAAQLENLQLRMGDLKDRFSNEYKERTNSMRDPFEIARQEKGFRV